MTESLEKVLQKLEQLANFLTNIETSIQSEIGSVTQSQNILKSNIDNTRLKRRQNKRRCKENKLKKYNNKSD